MYDVNKDSNVNLTLYILASKYASFVPDGGGGGIYHPTCTNPRIFFGNLKLPAPKTS